VETVGLDEMMFVKLHPGPAGKFNGIFSNLKAHRQDDHVKNFFFRLSCLIGIPNLQITLSRRFYTVNTGANESDAKLLFSALVVLLERFAIGAHVHVKNGGVQI